MPAVAPQATSRRNCRGGRTRKRPLNEDSIAASCTMGPSRPMEAPDPMESSEDTLRARVWRKPIPAPDGDGFHVIGRAASGQPARGQLQNQAGQRATGRRQQQPLPGLQAARQMDHAMRRVLSAQHHLYPGKQLAKHHGGQRAQQSHQGGCEQGVGQVFGHQLATQRPGPAEFSDSNFFCHGRNSTAAAAHFCSADRQPNARMGPGMPARERASQGFLEASRGEKQDGQSGFSGVKWRSGACPARISLWITTGARCCAHVVEAS